MVFNDGRQKLYLLIDVGNSHVKCWLTRDKPNLHSSISVWTGKHKELTDYLSNCSNISNIVIANVSKPDIDEQLIEFAHANSCLLTIANTQAEQFGLINAYQTPSNMGIDRWVAMLACRHLSDGDFLVIDLGTAITTDAVVNSKHIGGWIAPGYQLLKTSLLANTTKVFANQSHTSYKECFGTDTPDCVELGLRSQIQGGFELSLKKMQKYSSNYEVFVSGGDYLKIKNDDFSKVRHIDNLVLRGLTLFVD